MKKEDKSKDKANQIVKNRDFKPNGQFAKGNRVSKIFGGRPPGTVSLVEKLKRRLDEVPEGMDKKTWADILVERTLNEAKSGDLSMLRLAFQYIDGMPTQRIESENINIESKLPDEEEKQLRAAYDESASKKDSSGE